MPSLLLLRRRLRSVRSTRKITRAMELVASAKMKRAIDGVLASRPYEESLTGLLERLSPLIPTSTHPLLRVSPSPQHITLVVFSSDRGLCGAFNSAVAATTLATIAALKTELPNARLSIVTVGKKVRNMLTRSHISITADFPRPHRQAVAADIAGLGHLLVEDFINEKTDRVVMITSHFASAFVQRPRATTLLPLTTPKSRTEMPDQDAVPFEPSRDAVLATLLPRAVELILYQALLESIASEHAARRLAMKSATDAAKDIIDDLLLTTNQTRQATITREMAEITTAMTAMN